MAQSAKIILGANMKISSNPPKRFKYNRSFFVYDPINIMTWITSEKNVKINIARYQVIMWWTMDHIFAKTKNEWGTMGFSHQVSLHIEMVINWKQQWYQGTQYHFHNKCAYSGLIPSTWISISPKFMRCHKHSFDTYCHMLLSLIFCKLK